jgi:glycosyltransferase involved in cell wall biosynthesis
MTRLLAIVPYQLETAPSQRFRIEQWAPYLREAGIDITFSPFEDDALRSVLREPGQFTRKAWLLITRSLRRLRDVARAKDFDAVFLHREVAMLGPAFFERVMKMMRVPILYDFDDAIYLPPTTSPNGIFARLKMPGKTKAICRLANCVLAGNPILAEYARRAGGEVALIPTTIDTDKYIATVKSNDGRVTIGWSGSRTTSSYLELVRDALQKLRQRCDFRLLLIGCDPVDFPGIDVEILPWSAKSEVADLNRIDIGLMPLPDDQWARGKCALKALQYMALAIPTVTSPVGVNADIIRDGANGMLASTTDEWVEKMEALVRSNDLRAAIGEAGRQTVLRDFSAKSQVPRIVSIIQKVTGDSTAAVAPVPVIPGGEN